ncbi:MAG: hypothetical protein ABIA75_04890 [Candidatus Neomarinimicrobiota bacterium]
MKKSTSIFVLLTLLMVSAQPLFANYAFYRTVVNTCKAYRIDVKESDMSFNIQDEEVMTFKMNLTSMRNNFDMVMLVGFISAGQAIKHQKQLAEKLQKSGQAFEAEIPAQVEISVIVPMSNENMIVKATADADLVIQLSDGTINSSGFMRQIKDSIQTL